MARKKKLIKQEKNKIPELMGYKLGQEIFCKRYPDNKLSYGRIYELHEDWGEGACVTIIDYITSSFRISLMSNIIDNPTPKQITERDSVLGRKKKKR